MLRRKCCESSARHANSICRPKRIIPVSSQVSTFLVAQYDTIDERILWLCPGYHVFEWKETTIFQSVKFDADQSSDGYEIMTKSSRGDDEGNDNDDEVDVENDHMDDEDEQCSQMESGTIAELKNDDYFSLVIDNEATDTESIDKYPDNISY